MQVQLHRAPATQLDHVLLCVHRFTVPGFPAFDLKSICPTWLTLVCEKVVHNELILTVKLQNLDHYKTEQSERACQSTQVG